MPNLVDDIIQLKGINSNNETVPTLGHFQLQLFVGIDTDLAYRFHVVEKIDLGYDGIIGTDFLNDLDGIIDYNSDVLKIRNFTIKIDYSRPVYKIFPRSETIIECTVSNPEQKVGLILDQHLSDSLLIANCIVSVKNNNRVNISVVNTSEELITLDSDIKVRIQPLNVNSFQVDPDITSAKSTISRREEVLNLLRTDHLNDEEKNSLTDICSQYFDIFYLPGDKLTTTDLLKHEINTHPAEPINVKSYRFPEIHKKEVDKQISKMLSQDIIKPSTSPWSFPIWIVPKKLDSSGETKWRIVIDYRKLNDITVGESYPIPQINEILDQLGQSKYFTTLDLCSGFHQISISEKDTPKTAFTVPQGHFEFKRMPFGLKNAPATFQRLMNTALAGLQGIHCYVYLDDIVIYSHDLNSHCDKLCKIFSKLRQHNLKLQPDKCEFLRREVGYLGHVISENGVSPNPEKVKAVSKFPVPKCPKDVKSFLGLVSYYRRFIPDFSKTAKPLTTLLKKDVLFNWSIEQQAAFDDLKNKLISAPILIYPDFTNPFVLTCDASNYAISAILSQGEIGKDQPIAFSSRTLNKAEVNYSTTEKECLAIVFGTKTFRPYLYGHKFTIVTDHRPLKWLFNCKDPGSRLVRWRLRLEEFDYKIEYKKGKINSNADALSRFPVNPIQNPFDHPIPSTSRQSQPFSPITLEDLGEIPLIPIDSDSLPSVDLLDNEDLLTDLLNPEDKKHSPRINDPLNPQITQNPEEITNPSLPIPASPVPTNESYSSFLKAISNKSFNSNARIQEYNDNILKTSSKHIFIPTSIDLDESNPYVEQILSEIQDPSEILQKERTLYTCLSFELNGKNIYFLFTKVYHFDSCTYEEIFKSLLYTKSILLLSTTSSTEHETQVAYTDFRNSFDKHTWSRIYNMFSYIFTNTNIEIKIYHDRLIYPSLSEIRKILHDNHDIPIAGHLGTARMLNRIKEKYYWKNMRSDVETYIKNCSLCQSNKALRQTNRAPMQITTTSTKPFERIGMDLVGPLPEAGLQSLKYILTMQDDLTKFSFAYPIANATSEDTFECLVHFISIFGIPRMILTDQGTNFTAELFKKTCEFLKIKQIWSSPYHPQTQGALERSHSTLKEYLKSYVNENHTNWHKYVFTAMLSYNTSVHASTNFTPYELLFGHKAYIPDSVYEQPPDVTYPEYIKFLHHRLKLSREKATENIIRSKERSKDYYDNHSRPVRYQIGDYVYLKNHVRLRKALSPIWKGPYKVVKINGRNSLTLLINRRHVTHHYDEVKLAPRSSSPD
ncbi:unnamed protein product [Pieris macdunnoughi]|uniref:RNA-directed DNA polymerase n=1 Tax=Pieris macdunnoughi TaxID=345717 RepID=A0A821QTA6_9NEOP|nr:unnamed protein product [Pieris macdunnoughi]